MKTVGVKCSIKIITTFCLSAHCLYTHTHKGGSSVTENMSMHNTQKNKGRVHHGKTKGVITQPL